jgi:hypothetical protein
LYLIGDEGRSGRSRLYASRKTSSIGRNLLISRIVRIKVAGDVGGGDIAVEIGVGIRIGIIDGRPCRLSRKLIQDISAGGTVERIEKILR